MGSAEIFFVKSHNFAPFRRFDGTLLSYVRLSTRLRTNPSRTPKIHQNSDFLRFIFFIKFSPFYRELKIHHNSYGLGESITCPSGKNHAVGTSPPQAHCAEGTSLCRQAKTSQHRFYKVTLPEEASHNFAFEIALKTAYFQRIYFLFFLFKISKCINA